MNQGTKDPLEALRRLRTVFGLIMDEIDADPAATIVTIRAAGPNGARDLARISVAECFAEADAIILGAIASPAGTGPL